MKNILLLLFFSFFALPNTCLKAEIKNVFESDTSNNETVKALRNLKESIKGKTSKGNSYEMYAVKIKKDWVFLILDSLSIYSMKLDEVADQLIETDKSVTEVLCLAARSQSLIQKEKAKIIAGTAVGCYYKMQGKAAKMYSSVKKVNKKVTSLLAKNKKEYRKGLKVETKIKSVKRKIKGVETTKGKSLL
ncbi:MAG TPA: hypothetical protein VK766_01895 [Cytophagaceae bacterium]|jgi:hypothetical protein|nr:hypothetical protein [Cytophagaceae bacterium]